VTVFLDGSGNATVSAADIDGGSADNCGSVSLSASQTSFTCADIGTNNVTLTVNDGSGNMATCTSTVTVSDTLSPVAVCQNVTVFLDGAGNATITAADIDGGSTDNCGSVSLSASQTSFTCADIGANNVTLTVNDGSGNMATCTSTVTVSDTISPVASCQNITVYLNGAGNATITGADIDNGSSDNCGSVSLSASPTSFACADIGANTVTLSVNDANGNSAMCTSTVSVVDTVSPVAACQNVTVFLDGAGNATITAADIDGGSADNCGSVSLSASQTSFTCADIGANNVTLTVNDGSGNMATVRQP
jgi:prophage tail gpP-like protein